MSFINPWLVTGGTGDHAAVPLGTNATFTNVTWGAGTGAVAVGLAQDVWTFMVGPTTYTLSVGTVDNIARGTAANDNISVIGSGTLKIAGLDDTPGTSWSFTAGFTAGGVQNLSFSAGTQQVPEIPEPATMSLLALGVAGLGVARRLRKTQ